MKKVRLYIADMDEAFVAGVRDFASRGGKIETVGSSGNGNRALNDIIRLKPDVLITEVPLPGLDGIALLREIRRLTKPPAAIVCTAFYSNACMECARRNGVSFFLIKPVNPANLTELILECGRNLPLLPAPESERVDAAERRRAARAHLLLKRLGMPAKLSGCGYIVEAVARYHGEALLMKNLSRGLYAQLASRMDTTVSRVERSLRSAIAVAYERGDLRQRFPRRPSNKEFIEYMMRAVDEESE